MLPAGTSSRPSPALMPPWFSCIHGDAFSAPPGVAYHSTAPLAASSPYSLPELLPTNT